MSPQRKLLSSQKVKTHSHEFLNHRNIKVDNQNKKISPTIDAFNSNLYKPKFSLV